MEPDNLFHNTHISFRTQAKESEEGGILQLQNICYPRGILSQLAEEDPRFERAFLHDITDMLKAYLDECICV